jgi:type III restriction enzyme
VGAHPQGHAQEGARRIRSLDPLKLPVELQTALEALYGHYEKTFELWQDAGIRVPPCFIVVCQNTAISKLVYDFISGFSARTTMAPHAGKRPPAVVPQLRRNHGNPLPRPNTLLIDSEQLEAGDALDDNFRDMAADEIERFRREIVERTGDARAGDNLTDQELLREVMNTVGKAGQLGGSIRCVVSVSMLTEGWDANTVTHVLGVRAFGTQLLCEQVIGRALRRQSYELNEEGQFNVEYADVSASPSTSPPSPSSPSRSRHARRCTSRPCAPTATPSKSPSRVSKATAPSCPKSACRPTSTPIHADPDARSGRPVETRNAGIIGEEVT